MRVIGLNDMAAPPFAILSSDSNSATLAVKDKTCARSAVLSTNEASSVGDDIARPGRRTNRGSRRLPDARASVESFVAD